MNFYVNSQGQIIRVDPEDVFQGSVNANTINFIGAFPSTCPVTVAFRLPTGEWTTPASMGMNSDSTLPGVQQPDGTQFNIWRYTIPGSVTEYYGTVNLQFYVYAQGSDGNGNTIATASSSFEVKKGVPVVLPDPSDDYETLLTQILSALQQLQQADSEGALSAQQSAEAAANSASAAASSATAAEAAQTAAEAAQSKAETAAGSAATSATAAQTAQAAAEAAQTAAETAQAGAEQAKDDAQDLVNEAHDIAETTAQETAQNVVNNFVQTGGPFTNGIIVDKQIILRGNPESDTSESVLQHKEYGFNFYDVEEGTDLSGKSLFFDTENSPLDDSNFNGTSLEPLISFQNGCTLYVNPNVSPSNYSVYMSTPNGGTSYFYLDGQWMTDVYTFTGSGWVVSSVKKENFESDAAQMLADMLVVGTFFVPSRTRFDDGAQIPVTPLGAFDVPNKQYVDGTVKTESGYLQQAIDNEASARAAADTALRNSKYDKTGGTIDGNVQITGDLTVQGTTTTNDTETLAVKDNLIVTNSDGAALAGLSGLIIRVNSAQSYGIVYDPANEGTVKLGLGTYNAETGAFTFATGEGLPVAIRALSTAWNNLHLAAWDAASNQFIDAGKAVADFQEKLTFDTTPTQNSTNPVTSGGVFSALQEKQNNLTAGEGILISDTDVISFDTTVLDGYVNTGEVNQVIYGVKGFADYAYVNGTLYVFGLPYEEFQNIVLNDEFPENYSRGSYGDISLTLSRYDDDDDDDYNIEITTVVSAAHNDRDNITKVIYRLNAICIQRQLSSGVNLTWVDFPQHSGRLAVLSDIPSVPDIEPISEQVSDLSQSVDDIYTILQQEVYNAQDIEQEYSSRETADGADIIDGALETVKKIQGATVKTTNLIPFPYEGATTTVNGVTFTNNGDGSVTINGTASGGNSSFMFCSNADKMNLLAGTTYYFTCAHGILAYTDTDGTHYISAGSSFTWGTGWTFVSIYVQLNEGDSETNLTVYPMLNEGSSALPYVPYFPGLKNAYFQGLRSTGRNLFNINQTPFYSTNANYSVDGNTFTATATGTNAHIQFRVPTIIGEQYTISVGDLIRENFSEGFGLFISPNSYQDDASYIDLGTNQSHTFTATSEWCYIKFYVAYYYNSESPGTITFSNLMLNYGSSALPYEPYIAHEISLDTAIELPAWDSINPTTGKRIVGTNTVYLDEIDDWTVSSNEYEGKTAFHAGTYPNIVVHTSQNPKAICSRLPFSYTIATNKSAGEAWAIANSTNYIYVSIFNSRLSSLDSAGLKAYFTQERNAGNPYVVSFIVEPTESDISMEDRLPAYKNGSETVIQGATDNSEYGAENTLTQNYAEVKGTTEGGNS